CRGSRREAPLDLEVLVRGERELFPGELAGEKLLRQGRPVIGPVRLVADQHDSSFVTFTTQGFGGPEAGKRGAGDDDSVHAGTLGWVCFSAPLAVEHPGL